MDVVASVIPIANVQHRNNAYSSNANRYAEKEFVVKMPIALLKTIGHSVPVLQISWVMDSQGVTPSAQDTMNAVRILPASSSSAKTHVVNQTRMSVARGPTAKSRITNLFALAQEATLEILLCLVVNLPAMICAIQTHVDQTLNASLEMTILVRTDLSVCVHLATEEIR